MFTKFAKLDVLEVRSAPTQAQAPSLQKFADYNDYRTDDGFMYVRVRAISSRVNKNHDGWPSEELKKSYRTFIGKPIFVDHHNSEPKRARGVVVDAQIHVDDARTAALDPYYANAPAEHLPPTWIELLLEVDAKRFPKLARAIINEEIDGVSMGANVERSKCSHCGNWATSPDEYCSHIRSKGAYFDKYENGKKISAKSYEDCYGCGFFEISFVFDPADHTALKIGDPIYAKRMRLISSINREGAGRVGSPYDWAQEEPQWEEGSEVGEAPIGGQVAPQGEDEKVHAWRLEQLMAMGYSLEEAEQAIAQGVDYHDLENMIGRGADPQQAMGIVAKLASPQAAEAFRQLRLQGVPTAEAMQQVAQQFFGGDVAMAQQAVAQNVRLIGKTAKTADRNPPPQSEMQTAPDKVDTLRQEQVCPICGSDMEDGVCEVCSYEEPPEGFDNPDLEKAKEVDKQMRQEDAEQAAEGMGQQAPNDVEVQQQPGQMPQQPSGGASLFTSKEQRAGAVSSERVSANTQGGGGRINTQERPILPVTRQLSDKPKDQKTVSDSKAPVESKTRKENKDNMSDTHKTADGATALGEGVQAEKRVDVEGVGAVTGDPLTSIEHENVEKAMEQKGGPATDTWTGDEGDSLGQHEPVSSDPTANDLGGPIGTAVASTDKTADSSADLGGPIGEGIEGGGAKDGGPTWDSGDNGFPDHDPARVDLAAPLAEEVGNRTMTDPNEEFRSLKEDESAVTSEGANQVGGPIGTPIAGADITEHHPKVEASARALAIKSIKLAEAEEELGLVANKWDRVAELENKTEGELDAALDVVSRVKTAGLSKKQATTKKKTAGRMPSLQPQTHVSGIAIEEHSVEGYNPEDSLW